MATPEPPRPRSERMLTKLLIMCKAFGLTRDDRLDIANQILMHRGHHMPLVESYNDLDERELERMLDAMTGAVLVAHLVRQRQAREKARRVHTPTSTT